jgi:hypothetical protein
MWGSKKLSTTEEMAKKRKTMMEHQNQVKHIYKFWIENCPEYVYTDDTKTVT